MSDPGTIDIAITGARILTMDEVFTEYNPGVIHIRGNRIVDIGNESELSRIQPVKRTIDASGRIITPPFFNCHNHAGMAIFRGLGNDLSLDGWLNHFIWPAEKKFIKPLSVYTGSLVSMMEMVRSGTGIFSDMYFFEEEVARAAGDIGMRVILGEGLLDFPTPSQPDLVAALRHTRSLYEKFRNHPLISVSVAAHAPYTCSPDAIREAAWLATELGITSNIHLAETLNEVEVMKARYGKSPVQYLADLGFLGPRTVAHHCLHMDQEDIRLMSESGTSIATIPNSNMKLGSGAFRLPGLSKAGINVAIGTDGPASNNHQSMIREIQQLARTQKVLYQDPTVTNPKQLISMATLNGAKAYGMEKDLGSLSAGKKADLIIINPDQPHWYPHYDPYNSMVYAMHSEDVESVMVEGNMIMNRRNLEFIDQEKILAGIIKLSDRIR